MIHTPQVKCVRTLPYICVQWSNSKKAGGEGGSLIEHQESGAIGSEHKVLRLHTQPALGRAPECSPGLDSCTP